ncbi:MAG: hypothetical protein ACE5OR_08380 [bacterium]
MIQDLRFQGKVQEIVRNDRKIRCFRTDTNYNSEDVTTQTIRIEGDGKIKLPKTLKEERTDVFRGGYRTSDSFSKQVAQSFGTLGDSSVRRE